MSADAGTFIRELNPEERALREKWHRIHAQRHQEAQRALARMAEAEDVLRDLALSFNGGLGPVTMNERGLFTAPEKEGAP